MDPVDVCRDACDDALSTIVEAKTIDANNRPLVLLVFTCQWTSAITLTIQHNATCCTSKWFFKIEDEFTFFRNKPNCNGIMTSLFL